MYISISLSLYIYIYMNIYIYAYIYIYIYIYRGRGLLVWASQENKLFRFVRLLIKFRKALSLVITSITAIFHTKNCQTKNL